MLCFAGFLQLCLFVESLLLLLFFELRISSPPLLLLLLLFLILYQRVSLGSKQFFADEEAQEELCCFVAFGKVRVCLAMARVGVCVLCETLLA